MLAALLTIAALPSLPTTEWSAFKRQHGKNYSSPSEDSRRLLTFEANLRYIKSANDAAMREGRSFRLGVNAFTDLTSAEFAQYSGSVLSPTNSNTTEEYEWLHVPQPLADIEGTCSLFRFNGSSYAGGSVVGFSQEPSNDECCTACSGNAKCQHYNYKKAGSACTMYSTVTKMQVPKSSY